MKLFKLIILLLGSFNYLVGDEYKTVSFIQSTIEASKTATQSIWPDFDLTESPIIVTFKNKHLYAFNLITNDSQWIKNQDPTAHWLYSDRDPWGLSKAQLIPEFTLEDQHAYVFNLDRFESDPQKTLEVFIHERFHRHQFDHFTAHSTTAKYEDSLNIDNLAYMQIEEQILAKFFSMEGQPIEQVEMLKDFIAVNAFRRQLINESSKNWEDLQQKMEGLAEYVSHRFFDAIPAFANYNGKEKVAWLVTRYSKDPNISERAIKWRNYGIGAAQGYALDFLHVPDWKQNIEKGESLFDLMTKALNIDDSLQRIDRIRIAYSYLELRNDIEMNLRDHQQEIANLLHGYEKLEGVSICIAAPSNALMSGGGVTARNISLPDGSSLSLQDSSVMTVGKDAWTLKLNRVPYVFQTKAGYRQFKTDKEAILLLDGKRYSLKDLVNRKEEKNFQTCELIGTNTFFSSKSHPGRISIRHDGSIAIEFP